MDSYPRFSSLFSHPTPPLQWHGRFAWWWVRGPRGWWAGGFGWWPHGWVAGVRVNTSSETVPFSRPTWRDRLYLPNTVLVLAHSEPGISLFIATAILGYSILLIATADDDWMFLLNIVPSQTLFTGVKSEFQILQSRWIPEVSFVFIVYSFISSLSNSFCVQISICEIAECCLAWLTLPLCVSAQVPWSPACAVGCGAANSGRGVNNRLLRARGTSCVVRCWWWLWCCWLPVPCRVLWAFNQETACTAGKAGAIFSVPAAHSCSWRISATLTDPLNWEVFTCSSYSCSIILKVVKHLGWCF